MLLLGLLLAATLLMATPASAHVEVTADPPVATASDATIRIHAEAESRSAGIAKLEIATEPPIGGVTLAEGPSGWTLSPGSAGTFVVQGPPLPTGDDATVVVKAGELPNAPQLVLKVLQTYTDGRVDRWIQTPDPSAPGREPEMPAPIVSLSPAPAPPTPPAQPSTAPSPSAAASPSPTASTEGRGASTRPWVLAVLLVVGIPLLLVLLGMGRRRGPPPRSGSGGG
jgi:uncharacterized protein YcnI